MPGNGHDHRQYVYTMYSRVPITLASLFGQTSQRAIYCWNFVFFGLPLWAIYNYGFFTTFELGGKDDLFYGLLYVACLWIWVGPLLICWWEPRLVAFLGEICVRTDGCVAQSTEGVRIVSSYRRTASRWGLFLALAAAILFWSYLPHVPPMAVLYEKPLMLAISFVVVFMTAFMSGYGWAAALYTIFLFKNLDRLGLRWDPLRGDEAGGLVFLGDFCVKTSAAFAVGTIILPYIIQSSRYVTNFAVFWGYFLTLAYSVLIILTSAVPLLFAVRLARRGREVCLGSLGERLRCIVDFRTPGGFESIRHDQPQIAWVDMLLNADSKVRAASILPFSPTSVAKVAILALLPFVSTAVRYIIQIL